MQLRSPFMALVLVHLCSLAGCGPAPSPPGPGEAAVPDPQQRALAAIEAETGNVWTVRYHDDVRTPAFLEGRTASAIAASDQAQVAARAFLSTHRALFLMDEPRLELASERTITDELGMTHVRFVQRQGSVRVRGGEVTAHFDAAGALVRIHGRYLPLPRIDLAPTVTLQAAREVALLAVQAERPAVPEEALSVARPELVIDPGPGPGPGSQPAARLAWLADVAVEDQGSPGRIEVWIDATDGQVYRAREILDDLDGSGRGVFGETQRLEIVERRGRYYLERATTGSTPQKTYSASGGRTLPGRAVSSDTVDRWDEDVPGAGAAVDAHAYVALTTAHYARVHGRAGAFGDGRGMRSTVHFGRGYASAFWNGRQLVFGDGDGAGVAPLAGALDVVAHEYAHAVTEHEAGLGHAGEPGALNEAIADIFACFVEREARGAGGNWVVGEDVVGAGGNTGLRDLADPHRLGYPAHLTERVRTRADRGGVHLNSTIVSHAGYLMTEGGFNAVSGLTVTGIGSSVAQRVWYRALTRYLGADSGFRDAADATIAAARDLYGPSSTIATRVRQAWRAVGVL